MSEQPYWKVRYEQRKRDGLCVNCGVKLTAGSKYIRCEKCRDKRAEERREEVAWRRLNGFCVICGTNKAKTGRVMCQDCTDATVERNRKVRQINRVRPYRDYRRKNHLCMRCGKDLGADTHVNCELCRKKNALANQKFKEQKNGGVPIVPRSERKLYGLCYICGDEVEYSDDALCPKCRERCVDNLVNARASKKSVEQRKKFRRETSACFVKR